MQKSEVSLIIYELLIFSATVAQLVEQLIRNQQVAGSSPATSSKKEQECYAFLFFFGVDTKRREPENPTWADSLSLSMVCT